MEIKIVDFPETRIAKLEHRDIAERVLDSAAKFIEWRKQSKLSPVDRSQTFGIAWDDPETTEPEKFRFDIAGSISGPVPANPQGVIEGLIPAGRCAVARHHGSHDDIGRTAHYLYRQWLPNSGEELRDFPCFFHYLNLLKDVPEHALETDVYLPLR